MNVQVKARSFLVAVLLFLFLLQGCVSSSSTTKIIYSGDDAVTITTKRGAETLPGNANTYLMHYVILKEIDGVQNDFSKWYSKPMQVSPGQRKLKLYTYYVDLDSRKVINWDWFAVFDFQPNHEYVITPAKDDKGVLTFKIIDKASEKEMTGKIITEEEYHS